MPTKRASRKRVTGPEPVVRFCDDVRKGEDWFEALLAAIRSWELPEEEVDGRTFRYLIGGEAFDWLLLAERLCEPADGRIPADEREALLFFSRPPRQLSDDEFKRAIGDAKHRAHLNFVYGVAVEEALQLTVEEEILKEFRSRGGWSQGENVDCLMYERIYDRSREELLAAFLDERGLPATDELCYGDYRAFTYWLFKFRVNDGDKARVASDTRKALVQLSMLEVAARRRRRHFESPAVDPNAIVEGEVVAHLR